MLRSFSRVLVCAVVLCVSVHLCAQTTDFSTMSAPSILAGASTTNLVSDGFMRTVIVDTMNPAMQTAAGIKDLVQSARLSGFDTLVVQVRSVGDAVYTSSLVPAAGAGFDALGEVMQQARTGGKPLKVYGMFTPLRVWKDSLGAPPANHVIAEHPNWISLGADGAKSFKGEVWLDPGVPGVQEHLVQVITELLRTYPLDGIVLDRLRSPDTAFGFGYAPEAVAAYNATGSKTGTPMPTDAAWIEWRRARLTDVLQKTRTTVRQVRGECRVAITAGTGGVAPTNRDAWTAQSEPCVRHLQDWVSWCELGLVDDCFLGNYKSVATVADYVSWMRFAIANRYKARMVICTAGWMNQPEETAAMMLGAIVEPNAGGVGVYCAEPLRERGLETVMSKILNSATVAGFASVVSQKFAASSGVMSPLTLNEIIVGAGLSSGNAPAPYVRPAPTATPAPTVTPLPFLLNSQADDDVLLAEQTSPPPVATPSANSTLDAMPTMPNINELGQIDLFDNPVPSLYDIGESAGYTNENMELPADIANRSRVNIPSPSGQQTNYTGERMPNEGYEYSTPRFEAPKITTANDIGTYNEQGVPVPAPVVQGRSRAADGGAGSAGFRSFIDRPSVVNDSMPDPSVVQGAETIMMKSGRSFSGKVLKRTPQEWTVKLTNGSQIRLQTSQISSGGGAVAPTPVAPPPTPPTRTGELVR